MTDQGTSVAPVSTLGDEIGALLGESWTDTDGPDTSDAAGDTPAERQDAPADTQAPEGTTDAERAGAPPADAADTPPDSSTTPVPTADEDVLAGAVPLAYTVNGESRTFDGIQVLKDNAGAIVSPEALQLLTRRLGERDHLFEQGQARDKKYSDLEKLTEWRVRDPKTGNTTTLTGREAAEERQVTLGHALAQVQMYEAVMKDPQKMASLLIHVGEGKYEHDPDRYDLFNERLANLRTNAEHAVRRMVAETATQLAAPPAPPTSLTPEQATSLGPDAVELITGELQITNLTPESKELLTELAPRYIRMATAEEGKANPAFAGKPIVDAGFTAVVKRIHAQQTKAATVVQVNDKAAKDNAARMAAALRGQRPKTPTAPLTPEPDPEASRSDTLWALQERAAMGGRRSA